MRISGLFLLLIVSVVFTGCGGGGGDDDSVNSTPTPVETVNISGKITYDLVPVDNDYIGLDYSNITQEPAKGVLVDAINSSNQSIASTSTDDSGNYTLALPINTEVKIRVSAKLFKSGILPNWDVKVVDNSNNNSLYVMEGSLVSTGTSNTIRNLNASSGWGGSNYTSARVAAPFAILDTIYSAMKKVLIADTQTFFPPLIVNWYEGSNDGTYYTDGELFIYGDEDLDTDEYDNHIIAHEWGHYYEDKFSRSDSIGGPHSLEDRLDIRVAFGEGWGNAFSGMALDDPIYFDTLGDSQNSGFNFNVESGTSDIKGWYSESSIQRILYDLYDSNDDGEDLLSLGFKPIHQIFTGAEKTTPAFTSIFTFIKSLKDQNIGDLELIDKIVSSEDIETIMDIYGTGRTNQAIDYPYNELTLGSPLDIELSNQYGSYNKLNNRKYIKFSIVSNGTYTIRVQQTNGTNSDPDFYLFQTSPFKMINYSDSANAGVEQKSFTLTSGDYLLDISDYKNIDYAQLTVTVD